MSKFLPNRDEINPHWFTKWGETFGSAELAFQLANNDRIFDRMRNRMMQAFGIKIDAEMKQEDVWAAKAYGADRQRLATICGLVVHGEYLKKCTSKESFETLSNVFSLEDMKIAVSLHHLHPQESEFSSDISNIGTLIQRSGKSCINVWKAGLEQEIGMRVYLMENDDEHDEEISSTVGTGLANKIITAVSIALNNEKEETAPIAA